MLKINKESEDFALKLAIAFVCLDILYVVGYTILADISIATIMAWSASELSSTEVFGLFIFICLALFGFAIKISVCFLIVKGKESSGFYLLAAILSAVCVVSGNILCAVLSYYCFRLFAKASKEEKENEPIENKNEYDDNIYRFQ